MINSDLRKNNVSFEILDIHEYLKSQREYISISNRCLFNQIIILKEAIGYYWIDSKKNKLIRNSVLLYSEGQIQIFENLESVKGFVFIFKDLSIFLNSIEDENLTFYNLLEAVFLESQIFPRKLIFDEILEITEKIEKEKKYNDAKFQSSIIISLFQIILIKLFQSITNKSFNENNSNTDLAFVYKFKKLLEENYSIEKNSSFYSSNLFISLKRLNEILKKNFNKTTKQMIEEKILTETKRHLLHSNLTVKEISYKVGFNDPTNFNKFFKRNTNHTPLEFRSINILL